MLSEASCLHNAYLQVHERRLKNEPEIQDYFEDEKDVLQNSGLFIAPDGAQNGWTMRPESDFTDQVRESFMFEVFLFLFFSCA